MTKKVPDFYMNGEYCDTDLYEIPDTASCVFLIIDDEGNTNETWLESDGVDLIQLD